MNKLAEREDIILKAIVEEFVRAVVPVGSRTLTKKIPLDLSSATIRNVMSDLEDMGYLYQPHTSSGRVPTTAGFRYYVERLMQLKSLKDEEIGSVLPPKYQRHSRFPFPNHVCQNSLKSYPHL